MGMMLKPRWNCRSGSGKGILNQKNADESVKDQGDVGCFLIGKALLIMNLYHVVRW